MTKDMWIDVFFLVGVGIGDFVKKLGKGNIAGIIIRPSSDDESENNIGFILKEETK